MVIDCITVTPDRLPQSPFQFGTGLSRSKAFLADAIVLRCSAITGLVVSPSSAGKPSERADGSLGF